MGSKWLDVHEQQFNTDQTECTKTVEKTMLLSLKC